MAPQAVAAPQPTVIDWSKAGLSPTVMQSIVSAPAVNSVSLGTFSQSVPLDTLRARTAGAQAQFSSQTVQQELFFYKDPLHSGPGGRLEAVGALGSLRVEQTWT